MKARTKIQDESGGSMAADAARIRELAIDLVRISVPPDSDCDITDDVREVEAELVRFAAAVERATIEQCARLAEGLIDSSVGNCRIDSAFNDGCADSARVIRELAPPEAAPQVSQLAKEEK